MSKVHPQHHVIDLDTESPKMSGVLPHSMGMPGRTKSKQNMVDLTQVNNTHRPNARFGQALDREVQNMLSGDDLEIEEGPEGDEKDGKNGRAQAKHKPLPEQVDALEIALTLAFREHRYRVEEILEDHMESMKVAEQAHNLEVSKLRSENAMLRERLGLAPNMAAPELYQTVALHNAQQQATSGGHNPAKGAGAGQNKASTTESRRKTDDDDGEADLRLNKKNNKEKGSMPTGSWQQFVCWVPSGSALQAPQPWQPLPVDHFAPVMDGRGNLVKRGMVNIVSNAEDEVGSEGSDESKKKKVRFKVVEVFIASQDELEASRQSMHAKVLLNKEEKKNLGVGPNRGNGGMSDDEEESVFFTTQSSDWFIIHPHSCKRICWDLASLSLVVYDMVTIPMGAFNLPANLFLVFMEWTTRIFWTLDMGMSSVTGCTLRDGSVQLEFRYIIWRYVKTWFALDVFIVASDWMEFAGAGGTGPFSFLRSLRTVRVIRLMRLVRMKEVMAQITERVQSEKLSFIIKLIQMMTIIVSIAHITACGWWGLGDRSTQGETWVKEFHYDSKNLDAQYLMSLHWSLSQFSGGMDEVTPAAPLERLYAVVMWLFAFMAATVVVSVLTSNLTQMHIIGGSRSRQLSLLRKFLKQNAISSNLALRMQRSAQHALSADLTADIVELLPVVSEPLRVEMHFEMYTSYLNYHSFFAAYVTEGPQVMRRICHYAMSSLLLSHGDVVFSKGESPSHPKMFFVVKGTCEYTGSPGEPMLVNEKQCVAEAVLWTRWTHQGTLTAITDVKLAALDAKTFQEISDRFKDTASFDPKLYASDFVAHLNQSEYVNDLSGIKYKGSFE